MSKLSDALHDYYAGLESKTAMMNKVLDYIEWHRRSTIINTIETYQILSRDPDFVGKDISEEVKQIMFKRYEIK